jgi:hypothetical protein
MLVVNYTHGCDFCGATKEERYVVHDVIAQPSLPQGWTRAYGDRIACEKHRLVVIDREAGA